MLKCLAIAYNLRNEAGFSPKRGKWLSIQQGEIYLYEQYEIAGTKELSHNTKCLFIFCPATTQNAVFQLSNRVINYLLVRESQLLF